MIVLVCAEHGKCIFAIVTFKMLAMQEKRLKQVHSNACIDLTAHTRPVFSHTFARHTYLGQGGDMQLELILTTACSSFGLLMAFPLH